MLNFDALTLKAFVIENRDFIQNASVRKIQQPSRRELIVHLWKNGITKKLYININPSFFHVCFVEDFTKRGIVIPNSAPMFCMLLRKYILNAKVKEVNQPYGERILEFIFTYKDVLQEETSLCLAIELMGKYSNVILYNKNTNIILGCAHNVGEEKSKVRELAGTLPYTYPIIQDKKDLLSENFEVFKNHFSKETETEEFAFITASEYYYLTTPLIKQIISSTDNFKTDNENLKILFEKLKDTIELRKIYPSISNDFKEFSIIKLENFIEQSSVNEMIDKYFEYQQIQILLSQKKSRLYAIVDARIKKLSKLVQVLENQINQAEKAETYKLKGDILMININHKVLPKVIMQNPYNNENITIELDTNLTIIQNANRYYKLYKKAKTAMEYASEQLDTVKNNLAQYEEQRFYIDIASTLQETEEISASLQPENNTKKEKKQKQNTVNIENIEILGYRIFIGKNSVQNDYLLSKISAPNDLWFHPLNAHGAHVILRKNNSKDNIPDEVILACAKLTKQYTKVKNDSKIPIIYTERKYVKKANSKQAFVTYKNEKEIYC